MLIDGGAFGLYNDSGDNMEKIKITKPYRRWLFGGIGFHNSEATMTPIMSEKFRDERILKCFREISPTFSRVYGGFADWTKEAMDHFADYYDKTFRKSETLIYMVPGRMPMPTSDFDIEEYSEKIATKLGYLIKKRKCNKIRYFCVTNELSAGNTYAYMANNLALFANLHDSLYRAFLRHGLDIGLLATDCSEEKNYHQIKWAIDNIDEITADYCTHLYLMKYQPGDLGAYEYCKNLFSGLTMQARVKQKRFILGEYGIFPQNRTMYSADTAMVSDLSYAAQHPENDGLHALAVAEMSLAILNSGTFAGVYWTLFDYPDPFIHENGDSPASKAFYETSRFSGHGLSIRYNKHGLIKWCDDEQDYSSRAALYTMGYMAKFFKKGSRVLECLWDNENLRVGAVTNSDGSVSVCIINLGKEETETEIVLEWPANKPMRRYDFSADNVPYNDFCDLQPFSALLEYDGKLNLTLGPKSVTFLTTDYFERKPSRIKGVKIKKGILSWKVCRDEEHCYYRVYASDKPDFALDPKVQIASTVAEHCDIQDERLYYRVVSVDKYGNVGE